MNALQSTNLGAGIPETLPMNSRYYSRGVTLIELMIVIVVLAIISSIAISSYRGYMIRTNRGEAKEALLRVQLAQEKFFLQRNRYALSAELTAAPPNGLGALATTPRGNYAITLATIPAGDPSPTAYVATATATGGQIQDTATCRTLTINQNGDRTPVASTGCWR